LRIQGLELISKYTQASARTLLLLSGGVLLIGFYDLNSKAWNIADRAIEPSDFREIATVVLVFALASHIVHWVADLQTYRKWFQTNQVASDSIGAIGSFSRRVEGMAGSVAKWSSSLSEKLDEFERKLHEAPEVEQDSVREGLGRINQSVEGLQRDIKSIAGRINDLSSRLDDIGPNFRSMTLLAKFIVFGWYLGIPAGISAAAMASLWCLA
jgi:hypothetical protein